MKVHLDYGRKGLVIEVPDRAQVLAPHPQEGLPDEAAAIRDALRRPIASPPLGSLVRPGQKVVIAHADITRATPNDRLLPILLDELEGAGIASRDICLLNSLGTHRKQTRAELRQMLGAGIADRYRVHQHDGGDEAGLLDLGLTSYGHAAQVNRTFAEADVRILTGFIEPHFFAGFSGGPKGVMPGLAGAESILENHGYSMLAHANATWGITYGNPVWEESREVALRTKPTFLLNVTLNRQHRITGVFAGDMLEAHRAGCEFCRKNAMMPVDRAFDIVVTTNSGYPLDQNLYQCNKGMSSASNIVRQGGTILLAAACEDGLPDHGRFAQLLRRGGSPQGVLDLISRPGFHEQDQWAAQKQVMVQLKAAVLVYSAGLTDTQIREALLRPCRDIEGALVALESTYGPEARICVLPEGPQTIPFIEAPAAAESQADPRA